MMSFKHSFSSSFILTLVTGKLHIHVFYIDADGGLADIGPSGVRALP
jgi:hypothetical protein